MSDDPISHAIAPEMVKKVKRKLDEQMVTRLDRILRAYGGTGPRHTIEGRDDEPRSLDPETV